MSWLHLIKNMAGFTKWDLFIVFVLHLLLVESSKPKGIFYLKQVCFLEG